MFTLEQIKTAHSKVKSGSDFPKYIQDMKTIGIIHYEHFVSDGHITYYGANGFILSGAPKWPEIKISELGSTEHLKQALTIHQQGQTDYPTFCRQSAEAGVDKWIVDITNMTCTYYDITNHALLVEEIPTP